MRKPTINLDLLRTVQSSGTPIGAALLSGQLNMPQATLGRQLRQLEELGYIEKIKNKGRVISERGRAFLSTKALSEEKKELVNELVMISTDASRDTLLEIITVRMMLEGYTAQNAALRAEKSDIMELESVAFAHRYNLRNGTPGDQEDLRFHLFIAAIAGNRTVEKMLELLLRSDNAYVQFSKASRSDVERQTRHHFLILEAIRGADANAAERAMRDHLKQVREDLCQH